MDHGRRVPPTPEPKLFWLLCPQPVKLSILDHLILIDAYGTIIVPFYTYKVYAHFTELWANKDIGPTLLCALLELGKVRKMNFIRTLLSIRLHSPRNLNCALSEKWESWIRVGGKFYRQSPFFLKIWTHMGFLKLVEKARQIGCHRLESLKI